MSGDNKTVSCYFPSRAVMGRNPAVSFRSISTSDLKLLTPTQWKYIWSGKYYEATHRTNALTDEQNEKIGRRQKRLLFIT